MQTDICWGVDKWASVARANVHIETIVMVILLVYAADMQAVPRALLVVV